MVIFLCILSMIFLMIAAHPFVTYPLSLRCVRRLTGTRQSSKSGLMPNPQTELRFAVCMCVYNEEGVIEQKMRNLLALRKHDPDLEILVYVDAGTDRTVEVLHQYADTIHLHVSSERLGKTHGMNLLVARATAPVIVFTDATVMLDEQALLKLRPYFANPEVGCVCGNLIYTNAEESVTAASGSLYWRLEEALKRLEEETGSVMGADGSLFAIRRALHRAPPDHIVDDMYVSFRILCEGYRIVQATDVRAYEESVSSAEEEFHRKVRIACQGFNVHRLLWPYIRQLDALTIYQYVSHKLVRWFTIYSLALSLLFLLAALLAAGQSLAAAALACAIAAGLALGYLWAVKPFGQMVDILLAFAGAGLGVWRSIRGERFQTWTPAASIRKG